jgi:hypothetical protein
MKRALYHYRIDAALQVKKLAGGSVPWWAVMARAAALRKAGIELKELLAVEWVR